MSTTLTDMKQELSNLGLDPNTFCFAPYITTDLDQSGNVYSCYRGNDSVGNWKEAKIENFINGNGLQNIRKDLYNGVRHSNCVSCWKAEDSNAKSPRVDFFNDYKNLVKDKKKLIERIKSQPHIGKTNELKRTEIRPSSLCNLQCMHCGPRSSTKWVNFLTDKDNFETYEHANNKVDHKDMSDSVSYDNITTVFKSTLTSDSKYKDEIKKLLADSESIHFTGGEPLLTPEHVDWLEYMIANNSTNQTLVYNSNLNIKNIERYFDYWKQFKQVEIVCSIDASFSTYDYFRMQGDIEIVKDSITKIKQSKLDNIKLKGSITFNMFSALRWKEILQDWIDFDLDFHSSLVLKNAVSSLNLPDKLRTQCIDQMKSCLNDVTALSTSKEFIDRFTYFTNDCLAYLENNFNNKDKFDQNILDFLKMCEKTNNKKTIDYFPELVDYV